MMFLPVSRYLKLAAEAMENAIQWRDLNRPDFARRALLRSAAYLRLAIKARAWAADDWATFHRI